MKQQDTKQLHWSAIVGTACSVWLILWLFIIAATLNELNALSSGDEDASGLRMTLVVMGILTLGSIYFGWRRLLLLKYAEFRTVKLGTETYEAYDWRPEGAGTTNKVSIREYRFRVKDNTYRKYVLWTFFLRRKPSIDIVYNKQNPSHNVIVSRLRAHYNAEAGEWRSALWHVVPRAVLFAFIVVSAVVVLLSGSAFFTE